MCGTCAAKGARGCGSVGNRNKRLHRAGKIVVAQCYPRLRTLHYFAIGATLDRYMSLQILLACRRVRHSQECKGMPEIQGNTGIANLVLGGCVIQNKGKDENRRRC
jgi:hypothetical protein